LQNPQKLGDYTGEVSKYVHWRYAEATEKNILQEFCLYSAFHTFSVAQVPWNATVLRGSRDFPINQFGV